MDVWRLPLSSIQELQLIIFWILMMAFAFFNDRMMQTDWIATEEETCQSQQPEVQGQGWSWKVVHHGFHGWHQDTRRAKAEIKEWLSWCVWRVPNLRMVSDGDISWIMAYSNSEATNVNHKTVVSHLMHRDLEHGSVWHGYIMIHWHLKFQHVTLRKIGMPMMPTSNIQSIIIFQHILTTKESKQNNDTINSVNIITDHCSNTQLSTSLPLETATSDP